jgi:23S rRNA pseudouridine2605 synthase
MQERLQKLMSQAGIASRREAESMILDGRVTINGSPASLGDKADPDKDDIRVDGARLRIEAQRVYVIVNKPMQVVTTTRAQDQERRPTVRDMVPLEGHLYPVGRLDADSEGLVLLTNDGDLVERLTHPRYHHAKVYEVTLRGKVREDVLDTWRRGVMLDDQRTRPVEIKVIRREARHSIIQITMYEGRKRQIRRIAAMLGYPVQRLLRTHLGTLSLGDLPSGEWRHLTESEIRALRASAATGGELPPRRASRPPMRSVPGRRPEGRPQHGRREESPRRRPSGERDERGPRPAGGPGPSRPARPFRSRRPGAPSESPGASRPDRPARPSRRPDSPSAPRGGRGPQGNRGGARPGNRRRNDNR